MFNYILLGLIQGVAEFLPISSSAHLFLLHKFLSVPQDISLDILLHLATVLVIIFFYNKEIIKLFYSFYKDFKKNFFHLSRYSYDSKYAFYLFVSTIPAGILGYISKDILKKYRSVPTIVFMLLTVSLYMLYIQIYKFSSNGNFNKTTKINFNKALLIGISQMFALIPGSSRSGLTIGTAKLLNVTNNKSIEFSFLSAVPLIFGAFLVSLKDVQNFDYFLNVPILVSFFTAFFVGLITIKAFLSFFNKYGFKYFILYRILLAGILLFLLF